MLYEKYFLFLISYLISLKSYLAFYYLLGDVSIAISQHLFPFQNDDNKIIIFLFFTS